MQAQRTGLLRRLERLGRGELSGRALRAICVAWLVCMLAPLLAMCFYAHPVFDDFPSVIAAAQAWAKTGSFFEALRAAWQDVQHVYMTWQGTWVAMMICAFQPMVFSAGLFFLTPVITLLALCLSAAYFVKALAVRTLGAGRDAALALYTALLTYLLQFMPSVREVIYWQSGTQYTWSLVAILLLLGLLLKLRLPQGKALYAWRCIALLACGAVLGGCPYPLALGGAVGMALVAALCLMKRSRASVGSLVAFAGVLASLIAVVLAPGNAARQTRFDEPTSAPLAILISLLECAKQSGQWFSPQLLALVIVATLALYRPLQSSKLDFSHPVVFSVFSFGVLAACFVPAIYVMGAEGYLVERILSSLFMMFAVLALLNVVCWVGFIAKKRGGASVPSRAPVWVAALCLTLFVWGMFSVSITQTPSLSAAKDVVLGNATAYDAQMTQREQQLAEATSQAELEASVSELSVAPPTLPVDMLPYQAQGSLPRLMSQYYRMQALVEQYGAGHIPLAEWDSLGFSEP